MSYKFKKGSMKARMNGVMTPIDVLVGGGEGGSGTVDETQVNLLIDKKLIPVNAGLSELQNKDKSTQTGKVWGTTSDGAGWIDAPSGGSGVTVERANSSLPRLFLSDGTLPTTKTDVKMKFEYIDGNETLSGYVSIKAQGNSSMSYPKKNFTIKMYSDDELETSLKHDFGYGNQSKYVLKANWIDHSHARNIVSARLWGDCVRTRSDFDELPQQMRYSPNFGAIDGFPFKLYANGVYKGIYTWNIPKDGWMFGMTKKDGTEVILCGEGNNNGNTEISYSTQFKKATTFAPDTDGEWGLEYPDAIPQATKDSFNAFINHVATSTDEEFKSHLGDYVSVPSLLDYYLFVYFINGIDSLAQNMIFVTYDGAYWYASAYDLDSVFGLYWNGGGFMSYNNPCPSGYQETDSLLWKRIEKCYYNELKARYEELRSDALSMKNIILRFEGFTDLISKELYDEDVEIFSDIPSASTNNVKQIRKFAYERSVYVDAKISALTGGGDSGGGETPENPDEPTNGWTYDTSKWVSGYILDPYGMTAKENSASYARTYGYGTDDFYIPVPQGSTGFKLESTNNIKFNIVWYEYTDTKAFSQRSPSNGFEIHECLFKDKNAQYISVSINYVSGTINNDELSFVFI